MKSSSIISILFILFCFPINVLAETWLQTSERRLPPPPPGNRRPFGHHGYKEDIDISSVIRKKNIVYFRYRLRFLDNNGRVIHTFNEFDTAAYNCSNKKWLRNGIWKKNSQPAVGDSSGKYACKNL